MSVDRRAAETRADALLKEAEITEAEKRSARVTLAGLALGAADGDRQAAKGMLREALEVTGLAPCEPGKRKAPNGCARVIVNYERPGRSS